MEKYNYLEVITEDLKEAIGEDELDLTEWDEDELQEMLYDRYFNSDRVTGNASGSYTFNAWKAQENLCHNWDLVEEAANEFGIDAQIGTGYDKGAEYWDVTIRCYLLWQAIEKVLEEVKADAD